MFTVTLYDSQVRCANIVPIPTRDEVVRRIRACPYNMGFGPIKVATDQGLCFTLNVDSRRGWYDRNYKYNVGKGPAWSLWLLSFHRPPIIEQPTNPQAMETSLQLI